jgi:hypothetical protein
MIAAIRGRAIEHRIHERPPQPDQGGEARLTCFLA